MLLGDLQGLKTLDSLGLQVIFIIALKPMDCGPWGSFFVNYKVKNPYLFTLGKSGKARVDGPDGVKGSTPCDEQRFFIRTAKCAVG